MSLGIHVGMRGGLYVQLSPDAAELTRSQYFLKYSHFVCLEILLHNFSLPGCLKEILKAPWWD